jgi:predicted 3-demethylubiquinone-9 3-methyltransferase (glyoxalase superfamily)
MSKITPFLWFKDQALDAALFYVSLFKNARMISPEGPLPKGAHQPFIVVFEVDGQQVTIMNAGDRYQLSPAFSFMVDCEDQAEVDYFWNALTADGGEESMCGWLVDKYGLSWQIIPKTLPRLIGDHANPEKAERATKAMFTMKKIDVAALQAAYDGDAE